MLLQKMKVLLDYPVSYTLESHSVSDEKEIIPMNNLIGKTIRMHFDGKMQCTSCGKEKKIFAQGFCYSCFTDAPESSPCIIKPELCEGHLNKGRDIEWEQRNHVQPHIVYLAVASGLKVGVTRATQLPTRWIDQGATYCIKVAETPYRQLAGEIEVALKNVFTDKTNWRKMLKNEIGDYDLEEEKWQIEELLPAELAAYMTEDDDITEIHYPVLDFPDKVKSIGFDKKPLIEGQLLGIKGQYLLLDGDRVLNIRKHTGYHVGIDVG